MELTKQEINEALKEYKFGLEPQEENRCFDCKYKLFANHCILLFINMADPKQSICKLWTKADFEQ
jgi:hypothetical protein